MKTENIIRSWLTSIFGLILMIMGAYVIYDNIKELTWPIIAMGSALGAIGFVFLFVKDELITDLFKKAEEKL
jgi:hypothetical protein